MPARPSSAAATTRRRRSGTLPAISASRSAAIGSIRVARRAGTKPDTSVAMTPTSRPTMIVRGSSWSEVAPISIPTALNSARNPAAITRPANTPITDAATPIARLSVSTERRTWRREAPSVRSRPISRVRWATVMLKVLKIRKPPTSTDTPANTSSEVRIGANASAKSPTVLSTCSLPVRTANSGPSSRAIAALSSSGDVPSAAATEMSS